MAYKIVENMRIVSGVVVASSLVGKNGNSNVHRHHIGHHLASCWCFPQIWLQRGVLDLSDTHPFWVYPWNHLCSLGPHQVDTSSLLCRDYDDVFSFGR